MTCCGISNRGRNILAFWIFGVVNNFGYVVMLSAAYDLLKNDDPPPKPPNATITLNEDQPCQKMSTGVILLADVLPCLAIKLTAPLFAHKIHYNIKITFCVIAYLISFILVATFHPLSVKILGVIFASISSGFGEVTFLSLTSHFEKAVVSSWSSGTGFAGVLGATVYLALTLVLSPATSIYIMLVIPIIEIITYFFILVRPATLNETVPGGFKPLIEGIDNGEDDVSETNFNEISPLERTGRGSKRSMQFGGTQTTVKKLMQAFKELWYFILCLFTVYMTEYLINQGLYEIIYFKNISLSHAVQYRWFQVLYQIGVFISRSSVSLFQIKYIHIFSILQFINLVLFAVEAHYQFVPSIYIIFAFVVWEGLLGGACYVNAFYRMYEEVEPNKREFSLGLVSVSDSAGIVIAGLLAIPVHNYICFGQFSG